MAFEHLIRITKAAIALVTGVLCWTLYIINTPDKNVVITNLGHHIGGLAQILFFLLGAMTIVELIDAHNGFEIITKRIKTRSKRRLIWIICILAFFLSAVLDNLTTTIVMISLIRKLMANKQDRLLFAGAIIIAANAGGAWSPIGDVTTTMLWIGGQITAWTIVKGVLLPSIACLLAPLLILNMTMKRNVEAPAAATKEKDVTPNNLHRNIVFYTGIGILMLVPVFKTLTHLPPFMGMLLGLGILWIVLEILHSKNEDQYRNQLTVAYALRKIDSPSILFFLGILLGISALESTQMLAGLSGWMNATIQSPNVIVMAIGLLSSVVDNVPLVAATMGMYSLDQYPTDHHFWQFLAYSTGTGGSALIIGSAAGVAAMGMEKIEFGWYMKKISWLALIGFFAGALVFLAQTRLW